MVCNYSAHWSAFKKFISKLPTQEIKNLAKKYRTILHTFSTPEEKLNKVKELIQETRESWTHLPLTIPKKFYTLYDPIGKNYFFPEDLKKRTYTEWEWGSYYIDNDSKVLKAVENIPAGIHSLGIKYFRQGSLKQEELDKVFDLNLKLYPLLKYIYLNFSNKAYRGLSSIYKKYGNTNLNNMLIWEEKERYNNLESKKRRDELRFEGYIWLLKILINHPDPEIPNQDTHFDQHGRFNTPFGEVVR